MGIASHSMVSQEVAAGLIALQLRFSRSGYTAIMPGMKLPRPKFGIKTLLVLIGFALVLLSAATCIATEPTTQQSDNPHSRRNAILNRINLPAGKLPERERRKRAKQDRGKTKETRDKVLFRNRA